MGYRISAHQGLPFSLLDHKFGGDYLNISRSTCHRENNSRRYIAKIVSLGKEILPSRIKPNNSGYRLTIKPLKESVIHSGLVPREAAATTIGILLEHHVSSMAAAGKTGVLS